MSMHKEVEGIEKFLSKVRRVLKDDKAPPIVIRGTDGFQEQQHAIYQMRINYENENYGKQVKYKDKIKKSLTKHSLKMRST